MMQTGSWWNDIPVDLRVSTERLCGSSVQSAKAIRGGVAPTTAFALRLADGRGIFFKGVCASRSNDYMRRAIVREQRVYTELKERLAPWAPACFGAIESGEWQVLILEDLGSTQIPPWTPENLTAVAHGYAEFHQKNLGQSLPHWMNESEWLLFTGSWRACRAPTPAEVSDSGIAEDH